MWSHSPAALAENESYTSMIPLPPYVADVLDHPSPFVCHVALVVVQLMFALMNVTAHPALEYIPPFSFCTLRLAMALPFLYWLARREGGTLKGQQWLWILPMGASIGTAYALVFVCNQRTSSIDVGIVQPFMPVSTAVLSVILGLERMSRLKLAGVAVAFIGTLIALRVGDVAGTPGPGPLDTFLLLLQSVSYGNYCVLVSFITRRRALPFPMLLLFWSTAAAEIVIACVGLGGVLYDVNWARLPAQVYAALLFAGIGSSCIAHGLNSWVISKVDAILPTVYSGVQVIFTVIFATATLHETLGWDRACGMLIVLAGVAAVARAKVLDGAEAAAATTTAAATTAATTEMSGAPMTSAGRYELLEVCNDVPEAKEEATVPPQP